MCVLIGLEFPSLFVLFMRQLLARSSRSRDVGLFAHVGFVIHPRSQGYGLNRLTVWCLILWLVRMRNNSPFPVNCAQCEYVCRLRWALLLEGYLAQTLKIKYTMPFLTATLIQLLLSLFQQRLLPSYCNLTPHPGVNDVGSYFLQACADLRCCTVRKKTISSLPHDVRGPTSFAAALAVLSVATIGKEEASQAVAAWGRRLIRTCRHWRPFAFAPNDRPRGTYGTKE